VPLPSLLVLPVHLPPGLKLELYRLRKEKEEVEDADAGGSTNDARNAAGCLLRTALRTLCPAHKRTAARLPLLPRCCRTCHWCGISMLLFLRTFHCHGDQAASVPLPTTSPPAYGSYALLLFSALLCLPKFSTGAFPYPEGECTSTLLRLVRAAFARIASFLAHVSPSSLLGRRFTPGCFSGSRCVMLVRPAVQALRNVVTNIAVTVR